MTCNGMSKRYSYGTLNKLAEPKMTNSSHSETPETAPHEIIHPGSRALYRYWEGLRGQQAAPGRDQLNLGSLKTMISWLFIIERHPLKPAFKWRLAGTGICNLWGRELTAGNPLEGWHDLDLRTMSRLLDGVISHSQPSVARFRAITDKGSEIGLEIVLLPMRPRRSNQTQIFGSILPFKDPDWSDGEKLVEFELSSVRAIWSEPAATTPTNADPTVAQASQTHRVCVKRPTLQVIEGGLK